MATISTTLTSTYVLSNPTTQNPLIVTSKGLIDVNSPSAYVAGIAGEGSFAWTVTNLGAVRSVGNQGVGIFLNSGGNVTNGAGGLISGAAYAVNIRGGLGTVINSGSINASGVKQNGTNPAFGAAVELYSGGALTNLGTITAVGANQTGVGLGNSGGNVTNGASNATGALIEGDLNGIQCYNNGTNFSGVGTVVNYGTIAAIGPSAYAYTGISLHGGGFVANHGTIISIGSGAGIGIYGSAGTVTNNGMISGGGSGVDLGRDGMLVNSGTILATSSIRPSGTYAVGVGVVLEGGSGTISNLGTINDTSVGTAAVSLNFGVVLLGAGGGKIVNGQAGSSLGLIAAYHNGVGFFPEGAPNPGTATLVNYGTIHSYGTLQSTQTGTIQHGTYAGAGFSFGGFAVEFDAAGTVDNFGMIAAALTAGGGGILLTGGLITNAAGALINGAGGTAVSLSGTTGAAATVLNAGILMGAIGIAISASDAGSNTIVNFGTIIGTSGVALSGGPGDVSFVQEPGAQLQGAVGNFHPGDTIDLAGLPFATNGTANLKPGNVLSVDENGNVVNVALVNPTVAGDVFTLSNDGGGGTLISESPGVAPYAISDPLMTNTSGSLVFNQVAGGQIAFTTVGGLGPEWEFDGAGFFLDNGSGNPGFLIRDTGNVEPGTLYLGQVVNGAANFTPIGGLGLEWQFEGDADFIGTGQTEFLIRNTGSVEPGALYLGQVVDNTTPFSVDYASLGGLGLEWQFDGTGDFLNDGKQGFLIRNTGSTEPGTLDVGEVVNGAVHYTQIGGVGTEWDFEGTGNFLGDGNTGFLLWNSGAAELGVMAIGEVVNGQLTFTDIGGVGPEWQFVGTGNYIDSNKTDFMLRNTSNGTLAVGSVSGSAGNATVNFTTVGGIGPEWNFHAGNPALLA